VTLKPITNMCDLLTPAEVSTAMGAASDGPGSSGPDACAYVSTAPAPGATDNATLSFGFDNSSGKGRPAFDQLRARLGLTDVSGVGDAAILEDNKNGTGKIFFLRADTIFTITIANGQNNSIGDVLITLAKVMASRV
jgi:hypothetical protein